MNSYKLQLLDKLRELSTHHCIEWDGMLINIFDPEYEACTCDGEESYLAYIKTLINYRLIK